MELNEIPSVALNHMRTGARIAFGDDDDYNVEAFINTQYDDKMFLKIEDPYDDCSVRVVAVDEMWEGGVTYGERFKYAVEVLESGLSGTKVPPGKHPLRELSTIKESQIDLLESNKIYTIEQLAGTYRSGKSILGLNLPELQTKALEFMEDVQEKRSMDLYYNDRKATSQITNQQVEELKSMFEEYKEKTDNTIDEKNERVDELKIELEKRDKQIQELLTAANTLKASLEEKKEATTPSNTPNNSPKKTAKA